MEKSYNTKLVLHIPRFAWENDRLVDIDYPQLKKRVFGRLITLGITGWYTTDSVGYYKGRGYDQELLTVFCAESEADAVIGAFREAFFETRDTMRQEAFAYERDGALIVVLL